jgi:hypothetical protein
VNTAFLLMAQYDAQAVIPASVVVRDYFPHLTIENFVRKVSMGEIKIPLMRIEAGSQKAAKGVHLLDLARYIDDRRAVALKEVSQFTNSESERCRQP